MAQAARNNAVAAATALPALSSAANRSTAQTLVANQTTLANSCSAWSVALSSLAEFLEEEVDEIREAMSIAMEDQDEDDHDSACM